MRNLFIVVYLVGPLLAILMTVGAARWNGIPAALLISAVNIVLGSIAVLGVPIYTAIEPLRERLLLVIAAYAAVLFLMNAAILAASSGSSPLTRGIKRLWVQRAALLVLAPLLTLATIEWLATAAIALNLAVAYQPMETRLASQTEDWRLAHVMSDDFREPDPVLLWRPVRRPPYNDQGFRGPRASLPKTATVHRIMCYGDSNTDGPMNGMPWAERLQQASQAGSDGRVEVLNAGVAGYTSYQGLMRLREEIAIYTPNVVLISFGWNDAAPAMGSPDKAFASSTEFRRLDAVLVRIRRLALKYKAWQVAMHYTASDPPIGDAQAVGPRVTREDFAENINRMIDVARTHGATPVLLTRPHRESVDDLRGMNSWRRHVPDYNDILRQVVGVRQAMLIDIQSAFATRRDLFADECHFTPEGHEAMAALVSHALAKAGLLTRFAR